MITDKSIIFKSESGSGDMEKSMYDPQGINSDAFNRANHTGTQTASTISDFGAAVVNSLPDSQYIRAFNASPIVLTNSLNGVVIDFDTIEESQGISIIDGEFSISETGVYFASFALFINVTGFTDSIELWVEEALDGVTWSASAYSARERDLSVLSQGEIAFVTAFDAPVITAKYRIKARTTGGSPATLEVGTISGGIAGGTVKPSARVSAVKVS